MKNLNEPGHDAGTLKTEASEGTPPAKKVSLPLISCIMPTEGRAGFVARSIDMFLAQDYANKELIIVYRREADLPAISHPSVRPVFSPSRIIGAKRNEAVRQSRGAVIAQWDDDDLYNTDRLSLQARPILEGTAHITGLSDFVFYDVPQRTGWKPSRNLFLDIYVGNVHGGSLMYLRSIWEHVAQYPNVSMAEDARFLMAALKRGMVVKDIPAFNSFVYMRHGGNTWKFEEDNFRRYQGWQQVALPAWAAAYG